MNTLNIYRRRPWLGRGFGLPKGRGDFGVGFPVCSNATYRRIALAFVTALVGTFSTSRSIQTLPRPCMVSAAIAAPAGWTTLMYYCLSLNGLGTGFIVRKKINNYNIRFGSFRCILVTTNDASIQPVAAKMAAVIYCIDLPLQYAFAECTGRLRRTTNVTLP